MEGLLPERLNDPVRFALVADRHVKAFRWEKQDWIPLGLIVNDPRHSEGITYDQWLNPRVFLDLQAKMLRETLEVGSDISPSIALNHMGNALYPSVFGAKITIPEDRVTSIQDTGPWVYPAISDIREVDDLFPPPLSTGLVVEAERFMKDYQAALPDWVTVVSPSKMGPFSLAELLRGSDFYLDMVLDPVRCKRLLELCTDSLIRIEKHLRGVVRQTRETHLSEFGITGIGVRVGEDSIVNISGSMIREFVLPYLDHFGDAFGGSIYVHFCTLEQSRVDHVFNALAESQSVFAASSQFGLEYYEEHLDELEGRLAIESLYGDGIDYVNAKFGSFENWARDFVPRFKNRSGLVLYFEVASTDEARHLWEIWQEAHL